LTKELKPIFIFCLPRSGSTLLQKILMTHPKIHSVSEPWIILPLVGMFKKRGTLTNYNHKTANSAILDFIQKAGGKKQFYEKLKNFLKDLYSEVSKEKKSALYFIDKTPRYYFIIDEINRIFPDAKFIFLLRNPIALFSSIVKTFSKNSLRINYSYVDLFLGPDYLLENYKKIKQKSIKLTYERLIKNPEQQLKKISEYLGVEFKDFNIKNYINIELNGKMGDKTGIGKYKSISSESVEKWKEECLSAYRKRVFLKYIDFLKDDYLKLNGVSRKDIIETIKSIKPGRIGIKDFIDYNLSGLFRKLIMIFQVRNTKKIISEIKNIKSPYY